MSKVICICCKDHSVFGISMLVPLDAFYPSQFGVREVRRHLLCSVHALACYVEHTVSIRCTEQLFVCHAKKHLNSSQIQSAMLCVTGPVQWGVFKIYARQHHGKLQVCSCSKFLSLGHVGFLDGVCARGVSFIGLHQLYQ